MKKLYWFSAVLALGLFGASVAWLSLDTDESPAASQIVPRAFVVALDRDQTWCLANAYVPRGTRAIEMTVGSGGKRGSALTLRGQREGRTVFAGGQRFTEGQSVRFPIKPRVVRDEVVDLCVSNGGRIPLQFAGTPEGGISFRYVGATTGTWVSEAGPIAHRFQWGRFAPFGPATLWLALLLAICGGIGAVAIVLRASRSRAGS